MSQNRRTARGMIVNPRKQLKYSFMMLAGGILFLTIAIGAVTFSVSRALDVLAKSYNLDSEVIGNISSSLMSALILTLIIAIALTAFSFWRGIVLSHRIYGPLVSLQKQIAEIKKRNFAARVHLRKDDELMELQDALNDLAASFEESAK